MEMRSDGSRASPAARSISSDECLRRVPYPSQPERRREKRGEPGAERSHLERHADPDLERPVRRWIAAADGRPAHQPEERSQRCAETTPPRRRPREPRRREHNRKVRSLPGAIGNGKCVRSFPSLPNWPIPARLDSTGPGSAVRPWLGRRLPQRLRPPPIENLPSTKMWCRLSGKSP